MTQALQFASDMKLGHYMKVPPRTMFWCQIIATIVAGTTQLGVQEWYVLYLTNIRCVDLGPFLCRMFANVTDFCEQQQSDRWVTIVLLL